MSRDKLTTPQAAAVAGISRQTLARIAKSGALPRGVCRRVVGQYVWNRQGLEKWLDGSDVSQQEPRNAEGKKRGQRSILEQVVKRGK